MSVVRCVFVGLGENDARICGQMYWKHNKNDGAHWVSFFAYLMIRVILH